jgi:hypothetical protein
MMMSAIRPKQKPRTAHRTTLRPFVLAIHPQIAAMTTPAMRKYAGLNDELVVVVCADAIPGAASKMPTATASPATRRPTNLHPSDMRTPLIGIASDHTP